MVSCINRCYEGDYIDNPYHTLQYGGDTPDFGPQDHSKKNNPLDNGLEYENFCPDPKPPTLDTSFPRLGQGTDTGFEEASSLNPIDSPIDDLSGEGIIASSDSTDLYPVSNFNPDDTIDPYTNLFDSNKIASTGALEYTDTFSLSDNPDRTISSTNNDLTDSAVKIFLNPDGEGSSSYTFASLDGSGGIGTADRHIGLGDKSLASRSIRRRRQLR